MEKIPHLLPLQQWICDTCREVIREPEDGYLEIKYNGLKVPDNRIIGFRVVHQKLASPLKGELGCRAPGRLPGNPLDYYLGPDGLTALLDFVDKGVHNEEIATSKIAASSMREWTDLMRRLHLPHFEEARFYIPEAISRGLEHRPYQQDMMLSFIKQYGPQDEE